MKKTDEILTRYARHFEKVGQQFLRHHPAIGEIDIMLSCGDVGAEHSGGVGILVVRKEVEVKEDRLDGADFVIGLPQPVPARKKNGKG